LLFLRPNQNLPADLSGVAHLSGVAQAKSEALAKAEAESEDLSKAGLPPILLAEHQAGRNFSCVLGGNKKIPTSKPHSEAETSA